MSGAREAAVRLPAWREGWWSKARRVDSPNFGSRPPDIAVDLAIVHSISLPPGRYGGGEIERLFTNRLDAGAHPYFDALRDLRVSAHFVVARDGAATQYVSCDDRAWHAGRSMWRGRGDCNDFSIGIELEGLEGEPFEPVQMKRLATLLKAIAAVHPIAEVVGHEHVAPGRKGDPGAAFDWVGLKRRTGWPSAAFPALSSSGKHASPSA